jgi:uncharacterized repeat protein (TIGR01451 family)
MSIFKKGMRAKALPLLFILSVIAVFSFGLYNASSTGTGGTLTSTVEPGNPTCTSLGYTYGYKLSPEPPPTGLYTFPNSTETVDIVNHNGIKLDWSASIDIDAVIMKGGPNANVYRYLPAVRLDTDLTPPFNVKSGKNYEISHVQFCFGTTHTPPTPPSCPLEAKDGRTIVVFDGRIRSDSTADEATAGPVNVNLKKGDYKVTLVSHDGYIGRENVTQPKEIWTALLKKDSVEVTKSAPSTDLEDRKRDVTKTEIVNDTGNLLTVTQDINKVYAFHAAYPDTGSPNSLNPICAAFDKISTPPETQCVLEITKKALDLNVKAGENIRYEIEFKNSGTANCTGGGVKIKDVLDANLIYVKFESTSNILPGAEGGSTEAYNPTTHTLSWYVPVLEPGKAGKIDIWTKAKAPAVCGVYEVPNRAQITSLEYGFEPIYSNIVKTNVTDPCPPPPPPGQCQLTIDKTVDKTRASVGDTLTYNLTVTNTGKKDCTDIMIKDEVSNLITYMSETSSSAVNKGFTAKGHEHYNASTRLLVWSVAGLTPNSSVEIKWLAKIDRPSKCGTFIIPNQAYVTSKEYSDHTSFVWSQKVETRFSRRCSTGTTSTVTPTEPTVLLTQKKIDGPAVQGAFVYLSQIPYTGTGTVQTILFFIALLLWSGALGYMLLGPRSRASLTMMVRGLFLNELSYANTDIESVIDRNVFNNLKEVEKLTRGTKQKTPSIGEYYGAKAENTDEDEQESEVEEMSNQEKGSYYYDSLRDAIVKPERENMREKGDNDTSSKADEKESFQSEFASHMRTLVKKEARKEDAGSNVARNSQKNAENNEQYEKLKKTLISVAKNSGALLSDDGIKMIVDASKGNEDAATSLLGQLLDVAKYRFPREDGYLKLNKDRIKNVFFSTYVAMSPAFIGWIVEGNSEKIFTFLRMVKTQDHSVKSFLKQVIFDLDQAYRYRIENDSHISDVNMDIVNRTHQWSNSKMEQALEMLISAVDEGYKSEFMAAKLAIIKVLELLKSETELSLPVRENYYLEKKNK